MLTDILGVMIAFVSIILLLSILVTALVQALQAALRLRAWNLSRGLADLIFEFETDKAEAKGDSTDAAAPPAAAPHLQDCRNLAEKVLTAPSIALMDRASRHQGLARILMGPNVSWVDADKLPGVLETKLKGGRADAEALASAFKASYPLLQRRFQSKVRLLTFGVALVVAVAFQVSAPQLLGELRDDAERRNAIVAGADRLLETAAADIKRLDFEDAAVEALQVLQVEFPDRRDLIGEASGIGTTRRAIVEELALALEDAPEGPQILRRYEMLLDTLAREQIDTARQVAGGARSQLAEYGIFLWPEGSDFYFEAGEVGFGTLRGNAVLGVLVTAILLSLGAPFCYEMLRNLANLRDTLSGKAGASSKPLDEGEGGKTAAGDKTDPGSK